MRPISLELHCSKLQRLVEESLSTINFLKVGAPKIITYCPRFGIICNNASKRCSQNGKVLID